jgi:hypothetical protein
MTTSSQDSAGTTPFQARQPSPRAAQQPAAVDDAPTFIHAWGGYGRPKTGPVPGERGLAYCTTRLYQHTCGHVEDWPTSTALDGEGCDACESAPVPGGWQPPAAHRR